MTATRIIVVLVAGILFGAGLALSTMTRPEVVLSFLRFEDFGLLLVLAGATSVTLVLYQFAQRVLKRPLAAATFTEHPAPMNSRTLAGAAIFGVGWGLCGVCPGPAVAGLGTGNWPLAFALVGMLAGAYAQGRWFGEVVEAPATRAEAR